MRLPTCRERGEIHISRHDTIDGPKLRITRADPTAWITDELLREAASPEAQWTTVRDGVLTIRADNRTVVYRIGEYDPKENRWELSWPD